MRGAPRDAFPAFLARQPVSVVLQQLEASHRAEMFRVAPGKHRRRYAVVSAGEEEERAVDLVAPGYHGIRTGEPEGPYWGRIGRTAGWERTGEGFRNFRLDHPYVGILPFVFALFAFVPAVRARIRAGRSGTGR